MKYRIGFKRMPRICVNIDYDKDYDIVSLNNVQYYRLGFIRHFLKQTSFFEKYSKDTLLIITKDN